MSNINALKLESKKTENKFHSKTVECLKDCSDYNILITSHQKNYKDCSYFSKAFSTSKNNIFLINNISSSEIINKISEDSINDNKNLLISYDYGTFFNKENNEIEQTIKEEKIQFPIEYEKLNINFLDNSNDNFKNNKGLNLLIRYDLNNKKDLIVLDKNIIANFLSFKINAKVHNVYSFLDKDIFILLDVKKIIKSIQNKLEYLKKKLTNSSNSINCFLVQLLEYPNIGMIIYPNPELPKLDLNKVKTNFNSIVKQKFLLKSILISLNISSVFKSISLKINNSNLKKIEKNKEWINDSIYDENTSASSSNSPKISSYKFYKNADNSNYNLNPKLNTNLFFLNNNNNPKINDLNFNYNEIFNNYLNFNFENQFKNENIIINNNNKKMTINNNLYYNNNEQKKYFCYQNYYDIFSIIINSDDIFSKTLFNRYQDKSNSTCNLKILIEFLKIKMKKSISELTLSDFFSSFSKHSSFSLKIPFFNIKGKVIKSNFTPSLQEIKLFIKNPKFIKKVEKKLKIKSIIPENNNDLSNTSLNIEEKNIYKEYEGFEIGFLENKTLLQIIYKEKKPYYLADSLYDKFEHLMNLFKSLKKLNIDKNILTNKSYMSIGWNCTNSINTLSSSFISYYLFNGNFLGILTDIKENENNFWLSIIEEFDNKRSKINYNYLIEENYKRINDFINNIGQ